MRILRVGPFLNSPIESGRVCGTSMAGSTFQRQSCSRTQALSIMWQGVSGIINADDLNEYALWGRKRRKDADMEDGDSQRRSARMLGLNDSGRAKGGCSGRLRTSAGGDEPVEGCRTMSGGREICSTGVG